MRFDVEFSFSINKNKQRRCIENIENTWYNKYKRNILFEYFPMSLIWKLREVLLGYYISNGNTSLDDAELRDNYHEYDVFKIYYQGIIESFANPCNKQYIDSVPKGMKKKYSVTVKVSAWISK